MNLVYLLVFELCAIVGNTAADTVCIAMRVPYRDREVCEEQAVKLAQPDGPYKRRWLGEINMRDPLMTTAPKCEREWTKGNR